MAAPDTVLSPELCRTFVTLLRLGGSVSGAARDLGVSVATVSKRLRPLARGCPPSVPRPWLVKQGRRFAPTAEGRRMLPLAEELAGGWAAFEAAAAADPDPGLTVACGHEAAGGVVLAAAERFRRVHPAAALRVAVVRGRQRIEGVVNGLYDVALVTDAPPAVQTAARRRVLVQELAEDELVAACAARSPWGAEFADPLRPVTAAEALAWPMVLPEAEAAIRRRWDELLRRKEPGATPRVAIEVGGWRVMLGYVQAGFGVGLVPRSVAAGGKVKVRPLAAAIRPANKVFAVRLPGTGKADFVAAFFDALAGAT